jgi:hypothetical protein
MQKHFTAVMKHTMVTPSTKDGSTKRSVLKAYRSQASSGTGDDCGKFYIVDRWCNIVVRNLDTMEEVRKVLKCLFLTESNDQHVLYGLSKRGILASPAVIPELFM